MKILFLIRSLENGGAERQLVLLANELGRRRHSVTIGAFYGGGVHEKSVRPDAVRLIDLKKTSRWNMAGFALNLLRLVRSEQPDVIHGYLSAGNLAAALGQLAAPASQLVWGIRDSDIGAKNYGWVTKVASSLLRLVSRRAGLMIFNSQTGYNHWASGGYAVRNSVCVPNGIDTTEFFPDPGAGLRFREQYGIAASVPLVGMVARLDPAKDHAGFLRAAAKVMQRIPQAHFLCLGEGSAEYRKRLQDLANELRISHQVLWPEPTRAMNQVYNSLDVFCLASHAEGFPNVVAEAMACGRKCVVTDVGDAAFVVGETGRVVPPGDPDELATAILAVLGQSVADISSPRRRVQDEFSIEAMATRTEDAFLGRGAGRLGIRPSRVDSLA
jgi:glycosyltransferase involved in cell wall biosynthesis